MDNHIMSTNERLEPRDERCRRQHVVRYRYTARERKRLRQQQIKDDLRGLRVPSIVCLTFSIIFTLGSIAMTACGYYAETLATTDVDNSTDYVDEDLKEYLTDLKRIGPVLIGCGIFTSMCALVIVFETRGDKSEPITKRKNSNNVCYMEYNFDGTDQDSNGNTGVKQLATLDVGNLPQTSMQCLNDSKVENETKTLTSEAITESNRKEDSSRHIQNSIESQLNNYEIDYDKPGVSNISDRTKIADNHSLLNYEPRCQPLPPLYLESTREESVLRRSEINRVARGSNKKRQNRIPILDNISTEKSLHDDNKNIDEVVKNETENDTFMLIDTNDDIGPQKKGKRRSLRGSLKRKRKLTNTVQPSDNAAFDVTHIDDDENSKTTAHATSRSQPASSTFSRKFSNEAWPADDTNDIDSVGKRTLNGAFRSESSLVLSNTTQRNLAKGDSNNFNLELATSQLRTRESENISE